MLQTMNRSQTKDLLWLLLFAALSMLPALNLYYIGEEAIFPITSLEMRQNGMWMIQHLYGTDVRHNPLFNWMIIPVANVVGWAHMEWAARSITIAATWSSAAILGWLCLRLYGEARFAVFAALLYLTFSYVMMYHGWLAYVDPLFAMFIFAAIAALWIGCKEQRRDLFFVAALSISLALLSKAFTAYVFYFAAMLVLGLQRDYRRMLLSKTSLLAHVLILAFPLWWFSLLPAGGAQSGRMFDEILAKLALPGILEYLQRLVSFPVEVWLGLLPGTALGTYFWLRHRNAEADEQPRHFQTALMIAGLNFMPYWLAPHGGMRYLIPMYPLFALVLARLVWRAGDVAIRTTARWLIAAIAFNFVVLLALFPYYQSHYRGENYQVTAREIIDLAKDQPLYSADSRATGLNVTAYIDQARYPAPALMWPPQDFEHGYVIALSADETLGKVVKKYQLLGDEMYLLCRGSACDQTKPLE